MKNKETFYVFENFKKIEIKILFFDSIELLGKSKKEIFFFLFFLFFISSFYKKKIGPN